MIQAQTQAYPGVPGRPAPSEITSVEVAGRGPLLLLLGSAIAWLVVSGILALLTSIQVHTPAFLSACPLLTYGRLQAIAESAFVYGWFGNAGLGLCLWIMGRLAAEPLRAPNWIAVGGLFWNLALLAGIVGIALGEGTAVPFLQLPAAVQPILLVAYGAIGVAGVLAWTGRKRSVMYAAHWYAVAALFLFPWLHSAAQAMLLWAPTRGVMQAIVGGWFAQSLWTLWIAPMALAGAYYVVPRITGKVLAGYDLAVFGFWGLLFVGGWTGGRHLIGGPVPVWIPTVAIVTSVVLLFHYLVVAVNLKDAFTGPGLALRYIGFGVAAYLVGGFADSMSGMRSIAVWAQFTHMDVAQRELAFLGGATMMLFGTLSFALPRIAGRPWASAGLLRGHLILMVLGIALLVASLAAAGWIQGHALNDAKVPFPEIAIRTRFWLQAASGARAVLLLGYLLLALNFMKTAACCCCRRAPEVSA